MYVLIYPFLYFEGMNLKRLFFAYTPKLPFTSPTHNNNFYKYIFSLLKIYQTTSTRTTIHSSSPQTTQMTFTAITSIIKTIKITITILSLILTSVIINQINTIIINSSTIIIKINKTIAKAKTSHHQLVSLSPTSLRTVPSTLLNIKSKWPTCNVNRALILWPIFRKYPSTIHHYLIIIKLIITITKGPITRAQILIITITITITLRIIIQCFR